MATFTSTSRINIRWKGVWEFSGPAGTVFTIADDLYDEFNGEMTGIIPGLTWVTTSDYFDASGGTISGDVIINGAVTATGSADFGAVTGTSFGTLAFSASNGGAVVAASVDAGGYILSPNVNYTIFASEYTSLAAALADGAGKHVHIPAGTYSLSSSLLPASGTRITGDGMSTKITMTANTPIIQAAASATGISVESMWIVGSATSASTSAFGVYAPSGCSDIAFRNLRIDSCFRGVAIAGSQRVLVDSVYVVNDVSTTGAIDISNSSYCIVANSIVNSPGNHGIDFREDGEYNRAVGCSVISSGGTGFVISGSSGTGVKLPGCEFIGCASIVAGVTNTDGCGFILENGAQYARVVGCYSSAPALHGFLVSDGTGDAPSNNLISGCISRSAGSHGFYNFGGLYTVFDGNRVSAFTDDGFRVNTTGQVTGATTLNGCHASDGTSTTGAGIRVTGSQEGVTITGCIVRNTAGYGIYIDSPKTLVVGSSVIDSDSGGSLTIGGITLTASADRSVVNGCASYRSSGTKQDYGVDVQSGCTNAVVTSCVLTANTTGTLLDNGTGTTSANNVTA